MTEKKRGRGRPRKATVNWTKRPDLEFAPDGRRNDAYDPNKAKKRKSKAPDIKESIHLEEDPSTELSNGLDNALRIAEEKTGDIRKGEPGFLTEEEHDSVLKYVRNGVSSANRNVPHHNYSLSAAYGDDGGRHWYSPSGDQRRESSIGFIDSHGYILPETDNPDHPTRVDLSGRMIWTNEEEEYHRENGPAVVSKEMIGYFKNNRRHRDNDEPAVIRPNGANEWWVEGALVKKMDEQGTVSIYEGSRITKQFNERNPEIQARITEKEEADQRRAEQEREWKKQREENLKQASVALEKKKQDLKAQVDAKGGYVIKNVLYRNGNPISARQATVRDSYGKLVDAYITDSGHPVFTSTAKNAETRAKNNAKKKLEIRREKVKVLVNMSAIEESKILRLDLSDIQPLTNEESGE